MSKLRWRALQFPPPLLFLLISISPLAILRDRTLDAQSPRAYFTDVAPQSQFNYVTRNDYRSRKYFIQPMCGGVAILDYDNDGKMDIFFTNGAELPSMKKSTAFRNSLLRNRGAGVFEDRTSAAGLAGDDIGYNIGAAAGDYDNDGYTDLFLANVGSNTLLHNNRDGTFTDATGGSGISKPENTLSVAAAWFDYDSDGLLDLVVSNYTIWTANTDYQCVDSLKREIYCSPTRYVSVPNRLYHNLGKGKFEDVTEQSGLGQARGKGMGVSIADVNDDGRPDIFIVNDTERNFLFINQGGGRFQEQGFIYGVSFNDDGIAVNGMGSDAKDFNNDGFVDLFYNDLATQVFALFAGDHGKSFRYVSYSTGLGRLSYRFGGWGAGFIDYDNDGWKDLYSANGDVDYLGDNAKQSDTMFRNLDGKSFADVSATMGLAFTRKGFHRGSAFADLNNDGSLDIVVTGINERPRILMNAGTPGAHWLLLDLQGTRGSRDAIGAKIKVTTESGRVLHNHVSVSTGFMSSSDRRVHFGLGSERAIASIEIRWPDGQVQILSGVMADQILRVREPE
jgi:enediyne biosynthesis protein E4